jgi:hypothetical protein
VDELGFERRAVSPFVAIPQRGSAQLLHMDRMSRSGPRTRLLSPPAKLRVARLGIDVAKLSAPPAWLRDGQGRPAGYGDSARIRAEPADGGDRPVRVRANTARDADHRHRKVSEAERFSGITNIFASTI